MRTITKTYKIYKYDELSEKAKEEVKQNWLNDRSRIYTFEDECIADLCSLFPDSNLKVQFSLNSCQGDGLNVYGKLNLMNVFSIIRNKKCNNDVFEEFMDYLTENEQQTIEFYMKTCGKYIELPYNNSNYSYCVSDKLDFAKDWIDMLDYCRYRDIKVDIIRKFEKLISSMFTKLSKDYEATGYKFFYEVDDEEMSDYCEANGLEFYEDGTVY